ncbi:Proteophosphoglycan ppg4 [Rhodotorula toruloides ATCC 204091]|uniref:DNA polymerase epsilon subunit D n=1 Tax=Rhodotorula toruloides TaxID=5286 RepID=A0A0K3C8Y8_RHOTO|nr:Proteophosphoglycan ppg4 [Rhodotorula toruloides ATCC 204091]
MPRAKAKKPAQSDPADEDGGLEAFELQKIARLAKGAVSLDFYPIPLRYRSRWRRRDDRAQLTSPRRGQLPVDIKLQKEVPLALVKGSTVFINYLAALSHDVATERNNKTISAQHVLDAVKQLGWNDGGELHKTLKKELAAFRAAADAKKRGEPAPAPPPKTVLKVKEPEAVPAASTSGTNGAAPALAAKGEAAPAAAETGVEAGVTVLRDDRPNADEENLYEGAEDVDEDALEEYVDEEEDEEMEQAGSSGVEDEVADRGLEEDEGDEAWKGDE